MKPTIADDYDTTGIIHVNSSPQAEFEEWRKFANITPDWSGDEFTLEDFIQHIAGLAKPSMVARQAKMPMWYETLSLANWETACSVDDSSPFNEWYAWKDRKTAIAYIDKHFTSDTFLDKFQELDGEYYKDADVEVEVVYKLKPGAIAANLYEMVRAESPLGE